MPRWPVKYAISALARSSRARDRVVVQPGVQLRRPDLVGAVHVDHVHQPQFAAGHRHRPVVGVGGRGHLGTGQVVADDVVGRHVQQRRDGDGAAAVLRHAHHRGRRRTSLGDDVDVELDRRPDQRRRGRTPRARSGPTSPETVWPPRRSPARAPECLRPPDARPRRRSRCRRRNGCLRRGARRTNPEGRRPTSASAQIPLSPSENDILAKTCKAFELLRRRRSPGS